LRKGDVLAINSEVMGSEVTSFRERTIVAQALQQLSPRKQLRVTPGPQSDCFPESSRKAFYESTYRVAEDSNRMGLRLEGKPISRESSGEMITEGVSIGSVQITAAGLPIILFVEQQTTGGYPKIANVISADLNTLGQLRPRDEIRFEEVGWESARSLLLEQEQLLSSDGLIL
jgi:antagonist of KipI